MCALWGISKSGYYKHIKLETAHREYEKLVLDHVRRIRFRQPRIGVRKIQEHLKRDGIEIDRDRLYRLLSEHGMLSGLYSKRRSFSHGCRQTDVPNLLSCGEDFGPGDVIVTDITYITTREGMLYLNVYMDYSSRMILSCHAGTTLHRSASLSGLKEALSQFDHIEGVIHHSNHGSQYTSNEYRNYLEHQEMRMSLTGDGKCYNNAVMERFHNTLKNEFNLGHVQKSISHAQLAVREAVEVYNRECLHTSLDYQTPAEVFHRAA